MRSDFWLLPAVAGVCLSLAGCEPASVTEARGQLGRGGARIVTYALPIARDTFYIDALLGKDTTRTADGRRAVTFAPETLDAAVGEKFRFDGVTLDTLRVDLSPVALAEPAGTVSFSETYDAFALEPRVQAVDTVVADSGTLAITTFNRIPNATVPYTVTLNGFSDAAGATLSGSGTVGPAPGDGTYASQTLVFDLAGVTVVPADAQIAVSGDVTWTGGPVNPALAEDAIVQTGGGTIAARSLSGSLDPVATPELSVGVEESQEIEADLDSLFGDLKGLLRDARLNDVVLGLTVRNELGARLRLSSFTLGVVELTAAGDVPRDGGGNIVYQQDSLGDPLQVLVADPGETTLTVAAKTGTTPTAATVAFQVAPLWDRVVGLLLDGRRPALVAVGTATAGDGSAARVARGESVGLTVNVTVALDITIPADGVEYTSVQVNSGLDLGPEDADQIAARVDTATARSVVTNATPFGVQVRIALVRDSMPPGVDADAIFQMSDRVELTLINLSPAAVDAQGRVTQPVVDTVNIGMTGQQSRVLFGSAFTVALRFRLLPSPGAGGRGAVQPGDHVFVSAGARVRLRSGGNP